LPVKAALVTQTQHTHGQGGGEQALFGVAHQTLDRSAAHVEKRNLVLVQIQRLARAPVDERGLLEWIEHLDREPHLALHGSHELGAVARLANGAGGDRHRALGPVLISQAAQLAQSLQSAREAVLGNDAVAQ
jgi:hypothetical protein